MNNNQEDECNMDASDSDCDNLDNIDLDLCSCSICKSGFTLEKYLKSHIRKYHPEETALIASLKTYRDRKHQCKDCGKKFFAKKKLNEHEIKQHHAQVKQTNKIRNNVCPLCQNIFKQQVMASHFLSEHNIELTTNELAFDSFKNFLSWKEQIEKQTKSKYVTYGGKYTNSKKGKTFHYFRCHRSGNFVSVSQHVHKKLKIVGSNKINAYCPASLKVTEFANGKCSVIYQETHVGHQNDLEHLFLSNNEREYIASKIAAKIPLDNILDEIRNSTSEHGLERIHLLTKKDLYNIERSFNLSHNKSIKHENDSDNVNMWIDEMQNSKNSCILFYKSQESKIISVPCLSENDFVLIIMTEAQGEILKKFGSDILCIDRTHEMNVYEFELVTLLVVDESHQGFPCAFLISNRTDESVMSIFYSCIKSKVGQIQPKVFMSDIAESFFNAFKSTMGITEMRYFCAWHVDQDWHRSIKTINGVDKQTKAIKIVRALLEERDIFTFNTLMKEAVKTLNEDPDMSNFGNYFETCYLQNASAWAYCFRLHGSINTNKHLEQMHRTLKYIYLRGKNAKQLTKALQGIMKFVREKMTICLITASKGNLASKIKDIKTRHQKSETTPLQIIPNKNGWSVLTFNNTTEIYEIQELNKNCHCQLQCTDCNICIHNYMCSCMDSSVMLNLCKHVHYLQKYLKSCTSSQENAPTSSESVDADESNSFESSHAPESSLCDDDDVILKEITQQKRPRPSITLEENKAIVRQKFEEIFQKLTTNKQCDIFLKLLKSAKSQIEAAKNE